MNDIRLKEEYRRFTLEEMGKMADLRSYQDFTKIGMARGRSTNAVEWQHRLPHLHREGIADATEKQARDGSKSHVTCS